MVFTILFNRAAALAVALIAALGLLAAGVAAAAGPAIDAKLAVVRIEFNGKTEVGSPADRAKPGDVLEYSTRFVNRGDAPVQAFTPTMPIPFGTEYVPGGTSLAPTHASLDGVTLLPLPLRRTVTGPDGKAHVVDVPASEYRAVRWTVGTLQGGAEVTVRARVRISPVPAAASSLASAAASKAL